MTIFEIFLNNQIYGRYKSLVSVKDAMQELVFKGTRNIEVRIKDIPEEEEEFQMWGRL